MTCNVCSKKKPKTSSVFILGSDISEKGGMSNAVEASGSFVLTPA